jgi:hypothetical protein
MKLNYSYKDLSRSYHGGDVLTFGRSTLLRADLAATLGLMDHDPGKDGTAERTSTRPLNNEASTAVSPDNRIVERSTLSCGRATRTSSDTNQQP